MKLSDLHGDLFPLIYSFIYELPLRSSSVVSGLTSDQEENNSVGITLSFPHTCSKILRSMDEFNPFQFDKFIQFYCLGINNERFKKLQRSTRILCEDDSASKNSGGDLNEIIPVVFYLNIPELSFLEHLNFERDLVPMERKFRKVFNTDRRMYEDFFFKIDRIIELLCDFIQIIKKKLEVQELSQAIDRSINVGTVQLPISSLISVIDHVDKVVNRCMKLFHWKAFSDTYFEDPYLKIPQELPLVSKKYSDCERIITLLKDCKSNNETLVGIIEELDQLLTIIDCYYCDKLAAAICLYFFNGSNTTAIDHPLYEKVLRQLIYYGMHNVPSIFLYECQNFESIQKDEELTRRLIYCTPDAYDSIDEKFQQDMTIIETCIHQSADSINRIIGTEVGKRSLVEYFTNHPKVFYSVLHVGGSAVTVVIDSFIEQLKNNPSHPTLSKNIFVYDKEFLKGMYLCAEKACYFNRRTTVKARTAQMKEVLQYYLTNVDAFKKEFLQDNIPTIDRMWLLFGEQ